MKYVVTFRVSVNIMVRLRFSVMVRFIVRVISSVRVRDEGQGYG